jgi:hypothetical protein
MSNQMTLFRNDSGAVGPSQKFGALAKTLLEENDLGEGIRGSYAIVSIKGGRFRLKYKGDETMLTTFDERTGQQVPVSSIDVVIVKANPFLNKQWYQGKYVEGSKELPDCYSLDGVKPSEQSKLKQNATCANCPKNQFGSMIGDNGQKQKACRDTKKLAIVPLADIRNATMGGAMLFRVPPSALRDLSQLADKLKGRGYPYNSVAVRLSFDMTVSHPKPTFEAIRPLNDNEADEVLEMFNSDSVERVLADNEIVPVEEVAGHPAAGFDQNFPQRGQPAPVAPAQPRYNPEPTLAEAQPVPQQPQRIVNEQEALVATGTAPVPQAPNPFFGQKPAAPVPQPVHIPVEQAQAPTAQNPFAASVVATQPQAAPAAQAPAPNPFAQSAPARVATQTQAAPVTPPAAAEVPAQMAPQLAADIGSILAGLDSLK